MSIQAESRQFAPPPVYRLAEAVALFFPAGSGITVKSLRNEARHGRLHIIKIANKDFVTAEAITAMLERCTCRVPESLHGSTSATTSTHHRSGSSLMEQGKSARAAAQLILQAHLKR
jgi:hypothetical protein